SSTFYLSLDDDLLRIFGGDKISVLMSRLGMEEGEPLQHPWLAKAIANAQKRVEGQNFSIRKSLLQYDDVMNQQRTAIYSRRREILSSKDDKEEVLNMIDQMATQIADELVPPKIKRTEYNSESLVTRFREQFNLDINLNEIPDDKFNTDGMGAYIYNRAAEFYEKKEAQYGVELTRHIERVMLLQTLDALWKDHLLQMDHLKEGVGLRGYAQKDPLMEYKREGYALFGLMMDQLSKDVVEKLFRVEVKQEDSIKQAAEKGRDVAPTATRHQGFSAFAKGPDQSRGDHGATQGTIKRDQPKVGRNDPCPCGAVKSDGTPMKYKNCCGK
ncbi:preprotein translocase subunit SecA, partial [bacterium]|nr:preprotein translocase subunit SecA [bacterium]